jgi:alpha-1,6-mannosyltransferase
MHLLDASMLWGSAGGIRRVLDAKHRWLPHFGWQHTMLAPGSQRDGGIDVASLPLPASDGYRVVWRRAAAAQAIERLRPDVVEVADPYTMAWAARDAARCLQVPAVAYCHSHLPTLAARLTGSHGGTLSRYAERAARHYLLRLYSGFDLVLAPSRWVADDLRAHGLTQVEHQPLGVDCRQFTPLRRDPAWRERWLRHHGLDAQTRVLLYVGRFAAEKNLGLLASAVALLGPGHVLVAVGSGPQPPCGERVLVLPVEARPAQLARLVASCDVFVHAGDRETFGLAALEAMACGTPLVTSSRCGLGELVRDVGLTLRSAQPRIWAEAIIEQIHCPSDAGRRTGLQRAREHDWPQLIAPWLERYRVLVEGQRASRSTAPQRPAVPSSSAVVVP